MNDIPTYKEEANALYLNREYDELQRKFFENDLYKHDPFIVRLHSHYLWEKNDEHLESVLTLGAELGELDCAYMLGKLKIRQGEFREALCLLNQTLSSGYVSAHLWVGYIYEHGDLVDNPDYEKAKFHYIAAFERGGYLSAKRRLLNLEYQMSGIFGKICVLIKILLLLFRTLFIAIKKHDDNRLYGINNALGKFLPKAN